jgi:hypothetical protein
MKNIDQKFSFSILKTFTVEIFLSLLPLLLSQQLFAQVQEKFDDASFRESPAWSGSVEWFDASLHELQLKAPPEAGTAFLSTPSASLINASWEFKVTLLFNPSGSNFARIYLTSDSQDLLHELNGYFILVGGSSDEVSLYKQTGTSATKLIDGRDGILNQSTTSIKVKATRDSNGYWSLSDDVNSSGTFFLEGNASDQEHLLAMYTGVWCRYTATRSDKFIFDDISVSGDPYTPPPSAKAKEVVITEIFADPSPRQDLPDYEFVEIYNRSKNSFSLKDWQLSDGATAVALPDSIILPGQYFILTSIAGLENFHGYGKAIGLSPFPSLNNGEDHVVLKNNSRLTIDSVHYTTEWYNDDIKHEGGWSLEIIDIGNICGEESNWTASEDEAGGTPGAQNSVATEKPDVTAPEIISAIPLSDSVVVISFNEKLEEQIPEPIDFTFEPFLALRQVVFTDVSLRKITIILRDKLRRGETYRFYASNVYDCAGNRIGTSSPLRFALPEEARIGDLVINEILFNPSPTGVDFVEIFNRSNKFVNLKSWSLANVEDGQLTNITTVCPQDFLFEPGGYLVFSSNPEIVKGEYLQSIEKNLKETSLPPFPDTEGSVAIVDAARNVIDELHYSKDMHSVFIKDEEGISLERISISSPNDPQNWNSAAATAGFATPGFANSNSRNLQESSTTISVDPEIFIPESGQPGFTQIHYRFEQGGRVANVKILDAQGRLIREVANNISLGTEGFFRWDGDHTNGTRARVGYYVVWFEVFSDKGDVQTFRKRVAIATRF